jgi:hypothetical protein
MGRYLSLSALQNLGFSGITGEEERHLGTGVFDPG